MRTLAKKFWVDEQGLELSEYAIMTGLIIVALITVITLIGTNIELVFQKLADTLEGAAGS